MYYKTVVEEYDPSRTDYTPAQLELFATTILKQDRRDSGDDHNIMFNDQLYKLSKREIPVDASEIDATLTNAMQDPNKPGVFRGDGQKMFWREDPRGRKVNNADQRKSGSSYYRG